jgi:hypothetical protein
VNLPVRLIDDALPWGYDWQTDLDLQDVMDRVTYSVVYCQEGDERLR